MASQESQAFEKVNGEFKREIEERVRTEKALKEGGASFFVHLPVLRQEED